MGMDMSRRPQNLDPSEEPLQILLRGDGLPPRTDSAAFFLARDGDVVDLAGRIETEFVALDRDREAESLEILVDVEPHHEVALGVAKLRGGIEALVADQPFLG